MSQKIEHLTIVTKNYVYVPDHLKFSHIQNISIKKGK